MQILAIRMFIQALYGAISWILTAQPICKLTLHLSPAIQNTPACIPHCVNVYLGKEKIETVAIWSSDAKRRRQLHQKRRSTLIVIPQPSRLARNKSAAAFILNFISARIWSRPGALEMQISAGVPLLLLKFHCASTSIMKSFQRGGTLLPFGQFKQTKSLRWHTFDSQCECNFFNFNFCKLSMSL